MCVYIHPFAYSLQQHFSKTDVLKTEHMLYLMGAGGGRGSWSS